MDGDSGEVAVAISGMLCEADIPVSEDVGEEAPPGTASFDFPFFFLLFFELELDSGEPAGPNAMSGSELGEPASGNGEDASDADEEAGPGPSSDFPFFFLLFFLREGESGEPAGPNCACGRELGEEEDASGEYKSVASVG